jgi:predicted kinase
MKTLYMTRGLPASGKTTAAKALIATQPGTKRFNKDDMRSMLDNGRWSKTNEEFVLTIRQCVVTGALGDGLHVIVDDTNFAPKHEQWGRETAKFYGAKFEILDFTHVSPEECIKRDLVRPNSVGSKVILDMWERYLKPAPQVAPAHDSELPDAMIVDIDGTVAEMVDRGPYDWDKVNRDKPRTAVLDIIRPRWYSTPTAVLFVSGRDGSCYNQTKTWLETAFGKGSDIELFMRPAGDMRRDSIVKREIYENHIKGKYNVIAIFDDRPQVIRECWQELGFGDRIFNVGTGREF